MKPPGRANARPITGSAQSGDYLSEMPRVSLRCTRATDYSRANKTMSDANSDLVNLMIEEIQNRKNIELVDRIFSENFLNHTPSRGITNDRNGIRDLFSMTHLAFPDGVISVEDQVSSGNKVWTRKSFSGTHTGPLRGMAATGKKITYEVFDILKIQDGKITEHWNVVDQLSILRQLDAIKL
jgi:predicted ester cyclase